jgi:hypothetical protein
VFHLLKYVGLGACFQPEDMWVTNAYDPAHSRLHYHFGSSVQAISACFKVTTFNADSHMFTIPTV